VELWSTRFCDNSSYPWKPWHSYIATGRCENGFDELKNQWGWGGFTTQDIERCQTSARACVGLQLVELYCVRQARSQMEAITSRALLLAAVGRATKHAGQTTLYLTPMHAAKTTLMQLIVNIRAL